MTGSPLVAEVEGRVGAEAEVFIGHEPEPFGHHINIPKLIVHPDYGESGLDSALLTYIQQIAEAIRCKRVTVADGEPDAALYEHHHFNRAHTGQRIVIQAQEGRVFYKASELKTFDPAQIDGWHMPLGRYQNARQEWDRMLPGFWNSVPEIVEPESARLHITVTGQEAYALMQQDRYEPDRVHAFVWTKRPINNLLIDGAARLGSAPRLHGAGHVRMGLRAAAARSRIHAGRLHPGAVQPGRVTPPKDATMRVSRRGPIGR